MIFRPIGRLQPLLKHIVSQCQVKQLLPGHQTACWSTAHAVNDGVSHWLQSPAAAALLAASNDLGLKPNNVIAAVERTPQLSRCNTKIWQGHFHLLNQFSFTTDDFLTIVTLSPEVLNVSEKQLYDSMKAWSECQFKDLYNILLVTHPFLLTVKPITIHRKVHLVHSYCDSRRQVAKLIMRAPNVVLEPASLVEEKFKYLQLEMRIQRPEIANSGALASSFPQIKTRYMCLFRAGLFRPVNPKDDLRSNTNPKLEDMLNSSDHYFATKVAKLTPFEFEVFQDLFTQELKRNEDENEITSESDSDSEFEHD